MNIKIVWLVLLFFFVFSLGLFTFLREKRKTSVSKILAQGFGEGFASWNNETVQDFLDYENKANPTYSYDLSYIQLTASKDDVRSLIDNNEWPWDPHFHDLWAYSAQSSPVTKYHPLSNADYNQAIYNQSAAGQILALNTHEGHFLTQGVLLDRNTKGGSGMGEFGKNSGLDRGGNGDVLRCHPETGDMTRIRRGGYDGLFSISPDVETKVPYSYLPFLVPGFSFLDAPCNPCVALNSPPDYSCPFTLGRSISPLWEYLWGIKKDSFS
jgi:hypothetical protein